MKKASKKIRGLGNIISRTEKGASGSGTGQSNIVSGSTSRQPRSTSRRRAQRAATPPPPPSRRGRGKAQTRSPPPAEEDEEEREEDREEEREEDGEEDWEEREEDREEDEEEDREEDEEEGRDSGDYYADEEEGWVDTRVWEPPEEYVETIPGMPTEPGVIPPHQRSVSDLPELSLWREMGGIVMLTPKGPK